MMLTKTVWLVAALAAGGAVAVFLAADHSFVPGVEDVKDPLGRPPALSEEVIFSASEFDRISGILVPKHADLAERIAVLNDVSSELATVTDRASRLPGFAASVNDKTGEVVAVSQPLPGLIRGVADQSDEGIAAVGRLDSSVAGVTTELEEVLAAQESIHEDLQALGPTAAAIAEELADIEESSKRLKPVAPVLSSDLLDTVDTVDALDTTE